MVNIASKGKEFLYLLIENLIQKSDHCLSELSFFPDTGWRKMVRKTICFLGDVGFVLRDIFLLPAYLAQGKDGSIVFIGREISRNFIENLYFRNETVQWEQIDRVSMWNRSKFIRKWSAEGSDLIFLEAGRFFPFVKGVEYKFKVPCVVRQVLTLHENPEMLIASRSMETERKKIRKAERSGYSFRFSNSMDEFDHFYHEMYLPFILKRHGKLAVPACYGSMLKKFQRGGLVEIVKNEQVLGAFLCMSNGETVYTTEYGKLDIETQDNTNMSHLLYWYSMLWAFSKGVKIVDFGASQACCSNGIFHHKNSWKPKVARFDPCHSVWHVYTSKLSPYLLERINEIQFITEIKKEFYRVILQPKSVEFSKDQVKQLIAEAQHEGLKGVYLLAPYSTRVIDSIANQNTHILGG
jgi:hypothetical protein